MLTYAGRPALMLQRTGLAAFYRTAEELKLDVPEDVKEARYMETKESAEATKALLDLKNPPTCIIYPDRYGADRRKKCDHGERNDNTGRHIHRRV